MTASLREKASSGIVWSAIERFGQQGCVFLVQLFLARLLAPEEFGLIAMVAVLIAISTAVVDAGFGRAIIQQKEVSQAEFSTVFFFNLVIGMMMMAVLYFAGPYVAAFYEQAELEPILSWLSLSVLLGAAGGVHAAVLSRQMEFKKLFWVTLPSVVVGGLVGITMAFLGYGVWALVGQMLSIQLIRTAGLWWQSGWTPSWVFDGQSLKRLLPFGSRLALSSVIDQVFQNLYVLVIGKVFSAASVGYFQRARSFQQLPVTSVQSILGRVAFPMLSKIQDDPARMKRAMSRGIQLSFVFASATMAGMAAVAQPMVVTLIGEKWLPVVPMLQCLCIVGVMFPFHAMNLNLLMALGHSRLFLRLEIIKKSLVIINILITYRFGVQVMIYGMIVTSFIGMFINTHYTRKFINYSAFEQFRDTLPSLMLSGVMCLIVIVSISVMDLLPVVRLILGMGIGSFVYLLGVRFLNKELKYEIASLIERFPGGQQMTKIIL